MKNTGDLAESHTSIHRLVGKVTEPYLEEEEKEIEEVYEGGVIPEAEGKVVPYLFVEADPDISGQISPFRF